jgi:hypothetical protein
MIDVKVKRFTTEGVEGMSGHEPSRPFSFTAY